MKQEDKKFTFSIGSDESGNGGMFGGCVCAAFKLTEKNLKILKEQMWFDVLLVAMDPKELDYDWVFLMAKRIKEIFRKNEDFFIFCINAGEYNNLWSQNKFNKDEEIKFFLHNFLHGQLKNKKYPLLHVVDNFWPEKEWIHIKSFLGNRKTNIDEFCVNGEKNYLSICLAAILAKDAYLEHFRKIQIDLKTPISNKRGYNHHSSPKKLEKIFEEAEKRGISREDFFKFCKTKNLQKYNRDLKNYLNLKHSK